MPLVSELAPIAAAQKHPHMMQRCSERTNWRVQRRAHAGGMRNHVAPYPGLMLINLSMCQAGIAQEIWYRRYWPNTRLIWAVSVGMFDLISAKVKLP
jgi:hypothetical protein